MLFISAVRDMFSRETRDILTTGYVFLLFFMGTGEYIFMHIFSSLYSAYFQVMLN